jgi:hypothetical protein
MFKRGLSKELDRVPEKEEPDNSPSKTQPMMNSNFGAAAENLVKMKKVDKSIH